MSIILIVIFASICKSAQPQCTASGNTNGNTFANDASSGSLSFSSPSNAKLNDGNYSTATATAVIISLASTNYLKVSNFGFSIPATAIICGIEVTVVKKASGITLGAYVNDNTVNLVKNGTITGSNYASSTNWGTSNSTVIYGGNGNLWGSSWGYTDINSSNFGVVFSANVYGLLGLLTAAKVDQVQINVYYDVTPLPIELENFNAIANGTSCLLSWIVALQNSLNRFVVQRSSDAKNWESIGEVQAIVNQSQYSFEDENIPTGDNYYRLQLNNVDGQTSYSAISMVDETLSETIKLYPNPAFNVINITNPKGVHKIYIRDEYGRLVKSVNIKFYTNNIQIAVADLKQGVYFVQIDGSISKLWKK